MSNRGPRSPLQYAAFKDPDPGLPHFILDIVIVLNRYKLVFLSLVIALLGTACSDEVKKKDVADDDDGSTACIENGGADKFLCLKNALQLADAQGNPVDPAVECAKTPGTALCGKYKFLNDGYGGFVYPQPVMNFLNDLYGHYVNYYYSRYAVLPAYRHFGEYFGLIYSDSDNRELKLPTDIDRNLLPVGIVGGGTVNGGGLVNTVYDSETCALCHFGLANDGFYRFGVPNTHLKYGGLKLAFNRFVCYAEAKGEFEDLETQCKSDNLDDLTDAETLQCDAYKAFLSSGGNVSLLGWWQDDAIVSAATRTQMLESLAASAGTGTACEAVGKLLPAYSYEQTIELSKWDGVRSSTGLVDSEAARIDRFYHSVMTASGTPRAAINDGVHAPVKIPLLGNLVPQAAVDVQDYSGKFLASGVVSSLQHYVRLHAELVGGESEAAPLQDDQLLSLMEFVAGLKLPAPVVTQATLDSPAYVDGKALFTSKGCADCHDVTSTRDQDPVAYYAPGQPQTDNTYAFTLASSDSHVMELTPSDVWQTENLGLLKPPHLQGLWTNQAFLHNGMVYSLENLFCLTGNLDVRDATYIDTEDGDKEKLYQEAPFLDGGHRQTCVNMDEEQRRNLIVYLLTL
jgi:hypothetical protein